MSPRRQQPEPEAEYNGPYIATADLYTTRTGIGAMPTPAYRAGMRVSHADVERFGWQDSVRPETEEPPAGQESWEAASGVHPLIAGAVAAQEDTPETAVADGTDSPAKAGSGEHSDNGGDATSTEGTAS